MVSERTSNPPPEADAEDDPVPEDRPVLERRLADRTGGVDPTFEEVPSVSVGELFELLAHPGRRYVLSYVLATEGHATCSELVDYVVTKTETTMTPEQFRERVASQFTHTHLPKLAAANLIDHNVERQIVERTEYTEAARPFLELAIDYERRRTAEPEAED